MQRVAGRVGLQAGGGLGRQGVPEVGGGQLGHVRGVQAGQVDAHAPAVLVGQAHQAERQVVHLLGAAGHHHGHPVGPQPARHEGQGVERRTVGPLGVVHHHDEGVGELRLVDEAKQRGARVERGRPRTRAQPLDHVSGQRGRPGEPPDHGVVAGRLRRVAGGGDDRGRAASAESPHQVRLADTGLAGDQHHRGHARRGPGDGVVEASQLGRPPDRIGGHGAISATPRPACSAATRWTASWVRERRPSLV